MFCISVEKVLFYCHIASVNSYICWLVLCDSGQSEDPRVDLGACEITGGPCDLAWWQENSVTGRGEVITEITFNLYRKTCTILSFPVVVSGALNDLHKDFATNQPVYHCWAVTASICFKMLLVTYMCILHLWTVFSLAILMMHLVVYLQFKKYLQKTSPSLWCTYMFLVLGLIHQAFCSAPSQ